MTKSPQQKPDKPGVGEGQPGKRESDQAQVATPESRPESRSEESSQQPGFDLLVDTSGLLCPEPVMILHGAIRGLASGKVLKVVATDPSTMRDIPKFCRFLGHELKHHEELEDCFLFFIRRA